MTDQKMNLPEAAAKLCLVIEELANALEWLKTAKTHDEVHYALLQNALIKGGKFDALVRESFKNIADAGEEFHAALYDVESYESHQFDRWPRRIMR